LNEMDNVNRIRPGLLAPDFSLPDAEGKEINLSSFLGNENIVLFFFPDTQAQEILTFLLILQENLKEIRLRDGRVIALFSEKKRRLGKLKEKSTLEFLVLADEKCGAGWKYGVVDTSSEREKFYPAVFIISKEGIIKFRQVFLKDEKRSIEGIISFLDELI
jgi:peroxiredoxin Q/BCP